jgi:hypothetical protein
MWPDAANHDHKLISQLVRCGQLLICVHGPWRYHWETPSISIDQLGRQAKLKTKPAVCDIQAAVDSAPREASRTHVE